MSKIFEFFEFTGQAVSLNFRRTSWHSFQAGEISIFLLATELVAFTVSAFPSSSCPCSDSTALQSECRKGERRSLSIFCDLGTLGDAFCMFIPSGQGSPPSFPDRETKALGSRNAQELWSWNLKCYDWSQRLGLATWPSFPHSNRNQRTEK